MTSVCVIPARFASSRLPGKPLALIAAKPMIQWVYEQAVKAKKIDRVIVATDHEKIKETVESFGGEVVMTCTDLASGTDRVAAAIQNIDADIVINLQGDEPFVEPELLNQLVLVFTDPEIDMATPIRKIKSNKEVNNPNVVKVVKDKNNYAIFFSRMAIPFLRNYKKAEWSDHFAYHKHIGIYAYRTNFLHRLTTLPVSPLEEAEKLEQLRVLENGYKIYTIETEYDSISVDTMEDLEKVNKMITN
ncbi:MAG: 3-deoxy-manno-octulosonate cytidylyltransferase [Calditrichaceae bacterium]|nr:3-deoxy-manno-octulosonate cytidylyltransferase [Calditrichaceae bacterium]HES59626.1 3-deoxy-manno-octulosonate cytidylyltransferase [Caldithrix sp.]